MWEQVGNTATDTRRNAYQNKTGRDTTEHRKTKMPKVKTEKTEMREARKKPQTRLKPGAEAEIQTTQTRACCKKTVTGTAEHSVLHFVDAPCKQSRGVSGYERTGYEFSPQNFKFVHLFPKKEAMMLFFL